MSDCATTYYSDDVPTLHDKLSRYNTSNSENEPGLLLFKGQGGVAGGSKSYTIKNDEWQSIMFYVLDNMKEVDPFKEQFIIEEWKEPSRPTPKQLNRLLREGANGGKTFVDWFMEKVILTCLYYTHLNFLNNSNLFLLQTTNALNNSSREQIPAHP